MSLVGNLEDLSLGDILQIISLSQKSGVLALASDHGSGRIVFRTGLVQAACLKGGANDLRQLLVGGGFIDPSGYDGALARARDLGVDVEETLADDAGLSAERIDALIKESVEAAILEMFTWPTGDFSFDVRSDLDPEDPHLIMPHGINAQYLAMEGLRLSDERARDRAGDDVGDPNAVTEPSFEESDREAIFGSDELEVEPDDVSPADLLLEEDSGADLSFDSLETLAPGPDEDTLELLEFDTLPDATDVAAQPIEAEAAHEISPSTSDSPTAADTVVARVLERAESSDELNELSLPEGSDERAELAPPESGEELDETMSPESGEALDELVPSVTLPEPHEPQSNSPPAAPPVAAQPGADGVADASTPARRVTDFEFSLPSAKKMPVVLIDPDVVVLEWVKTAIEGDFARVHVFQKADQGLARIRQYLIRGQVPLVLVSPDTEIDPLSGIHGLSDFVKRLKAQSPRLLVLGLREDEDSAPTAMPAILDGVLRRPGRAALSERAGTSRDSARQVLARALLEVLATQTGETVSATTASAEDAGVRVLREATAKLQEASSRGEILPVVLDFAAGIFARVAILIVRESEVFAVAGRGIPSLEIDPLSSSPSEPLESQGPGLIRSVLEANESMIGKPETAADVELLESFGGERPESIYLAPIESGTAAIALLYADQGSGASVLPNTSALEVVLHHAGLALDRAALERALWEADADSR